jgi:hypothetical protein
MKFEEDRIEAGKKDPSKLTIRELLAIRMKQKSLKADKVVNNVINE